MEKGGDKMESTVVETTLDELTRNLAMMKGFVSKTEHGELKHLNWKAS